MATKKQIRAELKQLKDESVSWNMRVVDSVATLASHSVELVEAWRTGKWQDFPPSAVAHLRAMAAIVDTHKTATQRHDELEGEIKRHEKLLEQVSKKSEAAD